MLSMEWYKYFTVSGSCILLFQDPAFPFKLPEFTKESCYDSIYHVSRLKKWEKFQKGCLVKEPGYGLNKWKFYDDLRQRKNKQEKETEIDEKCKEEHYHKTKIHSEYQQQDPKEFFIVVVRGFTCPPDALVEKSSPGMRRTSGNNCFPAFNVSYFIRMQGHELLH